MSPVVEVARRKSVRRALAHQCRDCRRHWALELIWHPAGQVVRCRWCAAVHASSERHAERRSAVHAV